MNQTYEEENNPPNRDRYRVRFDVLVNRVEILEKEKGWGENEIRRISEEIAMLKQNELNHGYLIFILFLAFIVLLYFSVFEKGNKVEIMNNIQREDAVIEFSDLEIGFFLYRFGSNEDPDRWIVKASSYYEHSNFIRIDEEEELINYDNIIVLSVVSGREDSRNVLEEFSFKKNARVYISSLEGVCSKRCSQSHDSGCFYHISSEECSRKGNFQKNHFKRFFGI